MENISWKRERDHLYRYSERRPLENKKIELYFKAKVPKLAF